MRARVAIVLALCLALVRLAPAQSAWLSAPETIAPGIEYFSSTDRSLVDNTGPIAMYFLKLDARRVRLTDTMAKGGVLGMDTVDAIANRNNAIAAINGSFFNRTNGEPAGTLKINGELISDYPLIRGAMIIVSPPAGKTTLEFEQLNVSMALSFTVGARTYRLPIDGVDTTRERGKLMLFTPMYGVTTDTVPTGTEWVLDGQPLHVVSVARQRGHSAIPRRGAVLSYGGVDLPPAMAALTADITVKLETVWTTLNGMTKARLDQASSVLNGAGLIRLRGKTMTNWESGEGLNPDTFINMRHPRTLIGVESDGTIWMAAIDGRQPDHSIGMTLADLARLAERLKLRDALNLDGGGSTTMVVKGKIVNRPSDPTGPRLVSDAVLVTLR